MLARAGLVKDWVGIPEITTAAEKLVGERRVRLSPDANAGARLPSLSTVGEGQGEVASPLTVSPLLSEHEEQTDGGYDSPRNGACRLLWTKTTGVSNPDDIG